MYVFTASFSFSHSKLDEICVLFVYTVCDDVGTLVILFPVDLRLHKQQV